MTIRLEVIKVSRHHSGVIDTTVIKWEGDECKKERVAGATWEEIELRVELEDKPTIMIANVEGDAVIASPGGIIRIIINNPVLFGMLKVNDVIPLITKRERIDN